MIPPPCGNPGVFARHPPVAKRPWVGDEPRELTIQLKPEIRMKKSVSGWTRTGVLLDGSPEIKEQENYKLLLKYETYIL